MINKQRVLGNLLFCLLCLTASSFGQDERIVIKSEKVVIDFPLDGLLDAPKNWSMDAETFESAFVKGEHDLYQWLTKDRTRAKLGRRLHYGVEVNLTLFDGKVPVEEVIIDFNNGKLDLISVYLFNRGDNDSISSEDFKERFMLSGKLMGSKLKVKPRQRKAKPAQGLLTEGYSWQSKKGYALLEHNEGAQDGKKEFLRLRLAHPKSKSPLAQSMRYEKGGAAVRFSDLKKSIQKDENGDIYIAQVPMVDQGDKGYCVCASVQRVFEHYGIGADMHQIAEIADSDPDRGTSSFQMSEELNKIDFRFKTRLDRLCISYINSRTGETSLRRARRNKDATAKGEVKLRDFSKMVKRSIDQGVPILWSLEVGLYPEEPALSEQASGGHMRLIIGYNEAAKKLIFSDSWGAGHEFKSMQMKDAYRATRGLFSLRPTTR